MGFISTVSTVPFRCINMLISRRRKYGQYTIFSGVDERSRDFEQFYAKVADALGLLLEKLDDRVDGPIDLMHLVPKKIIGTAFYTQLWFCPKSLEINYDRTFNVPGSFVSGEILFEVLRQHFSKQGTEEEWLRWVLPL